MKKGLSSTDSPEEKNFNLIVEQTLNSELFLDKFKELALIVALKEVAKINDLSLKQQVEIYSPSHWNDSPGLNLDKEFEAFKRCGCQGFISISEKFDLELANKNWYSNHLTFRNKQIIIDADHIGFKSNQGYKKTFIKAPVYVEKNIEKESKNKRIYNPRPLNRRQADER